MITDNNPEEVDNAKNDTASYGDDTIGENTGDSALDIAAAKEENSKPNEKPQDADPRVETVVPDNDN